MFSNVLLTCMSKVQHKLDIFECNTQHILERSTFQCFVMFLVYLQGVLKIDLAKKLIRTIPKNETDWCFFLGGGQHLERFKHFMRNMWCFPSPLWKGIFCKRCSQPGLLNRFSRDPDNPRLWSLAGLFARSGPQDFKDLEGYHTWSSWPPRGIRSHFGEEDDDTNCKIKILVSTGG